MPEEILNEEKPPEEKLTVWQKIKNWVVGGTTAAVTIGAITVGVVSNSGHVEGDIYVVKPGTADSVWFADTAAAIKYVDSIGGISFKIGNVEMVAMMDKVDPITKEKIRPNHRYNFYEHEVKQGDIIRCPFYLNDVQVGEFLYEVTEKIEDGYGMYPYIHMTPLIRKKFIETK